MVPKLNVSVHTRHRLLVLHSLKRRRLHILLCITLHIACVNAANGYKGTAQSNSAVQHAQQIVSESCTVRIPYAVQLSADKRPIS